MKEFEAALRGGVLGVAAEQNGVSYFYNADTVFPTASCIKIAIVEEIFQQNLDTSQRISVDSGDFVGGSGVLATLSAPIALTLGDLAALTLSISDNTASNACLRAVGGPDAVNARLRSWGIEQTTIHRPIKFALEPGDPPFTATGTPRDFLKLLKRLSEGTTEKMALCTSEDMLPRYLSVNPFASDLCVDAPPVTVVHKTGATEGVRNDVGYIYSEKPELTLAVFTKDVPDRRWTPENLGCIAVGRVAERLWATLG